MNLGPVVQLESSRSVVEGKNIQVQHVAIERVHPIELVRLRAHPAQAGYLHAEPLRKGWLRGLTLDARWRGQPTPAQPLIDGQKTPGCLATCHGAHRRT